MIARRAGLVAALAVALPRLAAAQPVGPAPALATVQDEDARAQQLAAIVSDPAIPITDPQQRALAQALMSEGLDQLDAKSYDQALANFLEAYATYPSPKILLNIGSTLRDMGRLADAANTYQRYLLDPATGPERVAEVKSLLLELDAQLTILTIRVTPRGSELSIDAGPFITVGNTLQTRVRPGIHLVRIRNGALLGELTVNGFEGELKDVSIEVAPVAADASRTPPPTTSPTGATTPEHVDAWLATGTQYSSDGGSGNVRKARAGFAGAEIQPLVPTFQTVDGGDLIAFVPPVDHIDSGVIALLRIDGKLRGAAGGLGFAIARGHAEGEVLVLRSEITGAYLGGRYCFLTGALRPYVGGGVPAFAYDDDAGSTKIAIGLRIAGGLEIEVNGHFSVQGDLGYEHFFGVGDTRFEANVVVPTFGVIGRL